MALLFSRCACAAPVYSRVSRKGWMRLLPARRLYHCAVCGHDMLARAAIMEPLVLKVPLSYRQEPPPPPQQPTPSSPPPSSPPESAA